MKFILLTGSLLVSLGLMVINMGQHQVMKLLTERIEILKKDSEGLYNQLKKEELFTGALEKLLEQAKKVMEDLEAAIGKLGPEAEKRSSENAACQAEKKTTAEELANTEKERTETEATMKTESDAWKQEIDTLKGQLTEHSPICDFVKKDPLVQKLCDNSSTVATPT